MATLATQYPTFSPSMRIITAITQDYPAEITTSFAHGYSDDLIVRLIIPNDHGMVQANQLFGNITITGTTTFTIDIDTRYFSPFVIPDPELQYSQCIPFGEVNFTVYNAYVNVLPY